MKEGEKQAEDPTVNFQDYFVPQQTFFSTHKLTRMSVLIKYDLSVNDIVDKMKLNFFF